VCCRIQYGRELIDRFILPERSAHCSTGTVMVRREFKPAWRRATIRTNPQASEFYSERGGVMIWMSALVGMRKHQAGSAEISFEPTNQIAEPEHTLLVGDTVADAAASYAQDGERSLSLPLTRRGICQLVAKAEPDGIAIVAWRSIGQLQDCEELEQAKPTSHAECLVVWMGHHDYGWPDDLHSSRNFVEHQTKTTLLWRKKSFVELRSSHGAALPHSKLKERSMSVGSRPPQPKISSARLTNGRTADGALTPVKIDQTNLAAGSRCFISEMEAWFRGRRGRAYAGEP
jgi:hypothetical protein